MQSRDLTTPTIENQEPLTSRAALQENQQLSNSRAALQEVENQVKSPLEFRSYARAMPRKTMSKRKKGKSLILTDTPIKI